MMPSNEIRDDIMRQDGQMKCILMAVFCTCRHETAAIKQPHLGLRSAICVAMKCHASMIVLSCTPDSEGQSM